MAYADQKMSGGKMVAIFIVVLIHAALGLPPELSQVGVHHAYLDVQALSSMAGRQLPFFSLLVPFWLIAAQAGWRGMVAVWPACCVIPSAGSMH